MKLIFLIKIDYESSTLELLALLGNDEIEPLLSAEQITLIADFDSSHEGKKLIKHGIQLWELYARQYEQELMMNLVFQGVTGELLKEFISVFYQPLAQVYKAADISTTIRHVANFFDDLISVIDDLQDKDEEQEQEQENASDTIQLFIDLVARHEQHFYDFVHNVHSQEASKVFDELIRYVDKLFTFVAHGIPGKMDINHCIERAGFESRSDLELLEKEIDAVCDYRYQQKAYRFERQRRKMMIHSGVNADDLFQFIPKSSEMMGALQDFDELEYDVDIDDGKEEFSSSSSSSNSSSSSSSEYSDASSGSSIPSRRSSKSSGSHLSHVGIDKPVLTLIPKIVPYFVQDVHELMVQHDTTINALAVTK